MNLSERLKMVIKLRHTTQKKLAEAIGINQPTISGYCTGAYVPNERSIMNICSALGINEEWLRTGEGEMERQTAAGFAEEMAQRYGLGENAAAIIEIVAKAVTELDEETSARVLDVVYAELDKRVKRKKPLLIPHDVAEAALADALAEEKSQAE